MLLSMHVVQQFFAFSRLEQAELRRAAAVGAADKASAAHAQSAAEAQLAVKAVVHKTNELKALQTQVGCLFRSLVLLNHSQPEC
jgi:hypothetical protein